MQKSCKKELNFFCIRLDESHAEYLAAKEQASIRESFKGINLSFQIGVKIVTRILKSPMFYYIALEEPEQKELVGGGALSVSLCPFYQKRALISGLFVDEKHRGQGLAKKIFSEFERISRIENINHWFAGVYYTNMASHMLMNAAGLFRNIEGTKIVVTDPTLSHPDTFEEFIEKVNSNEMKIVEKLEKKLLFVFFLL